MTSFFRSKLYADFWRFFSLLTLVVALSSCVGIIASAIFSDVSGSELFAAVVYVFFIAGAYGLFASILGFWFVFLVLKTKVPVSPSVASGIIGVCIGAAVLAHFYRILGQDPVPMFGLLFFPAIPFVTSLAAFIWMARKFIFPHVKK